jgi:hypothetical protein
MREVKRIRENRSKISRKRSKLMSLSQPWQTKMKPEEVPKKLPADGVHLWISMYPRKLSLLGVFFFFLHLRL